MEKKDGRNWGRVGVREMGEREGEREKERRKAGRKSREGGNFFFF